MEKVHHTRRSFITTLIALPLVLTGLWRFLTPKKAVKANLLQVVQADIPAGGALIYKQERIALLHEEGQIVAISLICTHLGCTVSVTPEGIVCPCHGSRFDRTGKVLSGPAEQPLARLTVEHDGTMLLVRG